MPAFNPGEAACRPPLDALTDAPSRDAALLILVSRFVPDVGRKQQLFDDLAAHLKPGALC